MEKNKETKALFIQRFVAFIIDVFIITFISSLLMIPFSNTKNNEKYSNQAIELQEKFMKKEIDLQKYMIDYSIVSYHIARENGLVSLIVIFLNICYFVIFQLKMGGQTIGKKLMKIKVISKDGELFMNQMIFRSFMANTILMDIISFVFMMFLSKKLYFYGVLGIESIQYILIIISAFFVMFREDGCSIHDMITHTKVIRV
ncbi:MAG: RDD family protein [Bacilli bacterium]|nr:RDD family protein [Bacilli bacterium]